MTPLWFYVLHNKNSDYPTKTRWRRRDVSQKRSNRLFTAFIIMVKVELFFRQHWRLNEGENTNWCFPSLGSTVAPGERVKRAASGAPWRWGAKPLQSLCRRHLDQNPDNHHLNTLIYSKHTRLQVRTCLSHTTRTDLDPKPDSCYLKSRVGSALPSIRTGEPAVS